MQTTKDYFKERLAKQKKQNNFYVVFFDVDNLKIVNDEEGHLVGDEIIQELQNAIEEFCRPQDVYCRWGGDEFVLLFSSDDEEIVANTVNDIRKSFKHSIAVEMLTHTKDIPVDVSFGWQSSKELSTDDTMYYADSKMRAQKKAKRTLFQSMLSLSRSHSKEQITEALDKMKVLYG